MAEEYNFCDELEKQVIKTCEEYNIHYERTEGYFIDFYGRVDETKDMVNYEFASLVHSPPIELPYPNPDIRIFKPTDNNSIEYYEL